METYIFVGEEFLNQQHQHFVTITIKREETVLLLIRRRYNNSRGKNIIEKMKMKSHALILPEIRRLNIVSLAVTTSRIGTKTVHMKGV